MGFRTVCFVARRSSSDRDVAAGGPDRRRARPAVRRRGDGQRRSRNPTVRPARRTRPERPRADRGRPPDDDQRAEPPMSPDCAAVTRPDASRVSPRAELAGRCRTASPVAVRHRSISAGGTRDRRSMSEPLICSAKGCQQPPPGSCCGTTRSCTPPTGASLAGLRRAPRAARRLPGGAAVPAGRRARRRRAEDPEPGRSSVSRRWPTSAGRAGGTVGSSMPWPGALAAHRDAPAVGDLLVGGARAQRRAQVGLLAGEQAVADLAVGGEPDPVAVAAERAGHRGDDADRRRAAVDEEQLGGGAPPRLVGRASARTPLERWRRSRRR